MTRRVVVTAVKAIWRNRYRFVLYVWALGLIALSGSLVLDRNHRKVGFEHVSKTRGVAFQQDGPRPASQGQASASVTVGEYYRRGHKKCHSQTGECHCMNGYEGNECESAICPHKCIHGQCLRPGYCTCEEGWKGKSCEEATCKMRCVHGRCQYPNFCRCNTGWYGRKCDKQCANGVFSQKAQQCLCSEGWQGQDCQVALCEKEGCVHGYCTQPDQCSCHIAWGGSNCTEDSIQSLGDDFTTGLTFKSKRWPSLTMHTFGNNRGKLDEAWKAVKKWTSRLDEEWKFGRTRFISALPMNDTLQEKMNHKYKTCVAVGNSGSLLRVKGLGSVIDAHELILRYNDGPTRGYEDYVGKRTTIRLLNRKYADTLIAKYQLKSQPPMPFSGQKSKVKPKRSSNEMTMMWRAESYQHYAVLRRLLPEDRIYMLSPQFLIPLFTFLKSAMKRMSDAGLKWKSEQATPHGFVGVGLLIQICEKITVYGFDEPSKYSNSKYHYYDNIEPLEPHSNDVEFTMLRTLQAIGMIRLCENHDLETCVGEDQVRFGLV